MTEERFFLPSARRPRGPGRPRKADLGHVMGTSDAGGLDRRGPDVGAGASQAPSLPCPTAGDEREPSAAEKREARRLRALAAVQPRLLDVPQAAVYLGLPEASIYDLRAQGTLRPVRIPLENGKDLRKLLFDRADVDRLIDAWKE